MRFFHLADLHIGKQVNRFSMLPDQEYILHDVLALAEEHSPEAIVLSGDIYDRALPSAEAVLLYDNFLTLLAKRKIPVMVVAGNHDSPERLGFAGALLQHQAIYSYGAFTGKTRVVTLGGTESPVDFHLLPFLRPSTVRPFFPEENIETHHDAVRLALAASQIDHSRPSVLVAHQFVTAGGENPTLSDSDTCFVGGLEAVSAHLFDPFDYVALGHIHGPQRIGRDTIRYAGSPLKYSLSERRHQKSVTLVELEGHTANITLLPLSPLRDTREISGLFEQLVSDEVIQEQNPEDYLRVILTDEVEIFGAVEKMRKIYPNIMELVYENTHSQAQLEGANLPNLQELTPSELFALFYEEQNGQPPNAAQSQLLRKLLGETETTQ